MIILDGKTAAATVKASLQKEVQAIVQQGKRAPHLAAILVGNNGASETYVASKAKNCEEVGFDSTLIRLNENVSEQELLSKILELNQNDLIDGILVQLPLPKHISEAKIIETIDSNKDVDGFILLMLANWYKGCLHLFQQHHMALCCC
jgi:methylenetetrahydrofolate dehydrogenase (NADP+)/methenyltetrahydrofolate cyclohydrolase